MAESRFLGFDMYSYFYSLVRQIPDGMVTTYGDLAVALGDKVAARACGYMLSINPAPDITPCYRVVPHDGSIGNYTHPLGAAEKKRRLEMDGIKISGNQIENFTRVRFAQFKTDFPLKKMQEEQIRFSQEYCEELESDESFGAVDVSYGDFSGVGSAVINDGGMITIKSVFLDVKFPYIPGYLFYREFPFVKYLFKSFTGTILMDGNGLLHPRKAGLATISGIVLNKRTIGVAKSLLLGTVRGNGVYLESKRVATILSRKTIVSAGNGITLDVAEKVVRGLPGKNYPDILMRAHNECTALRKGVILS